MEDTTPFSQAPRPQKWDASLAPLALSLTQLLPRVVCNHVRLLLSVWVKDNSTFIWFNLMCSTCVPTSFLLLLSRLNWWHSFFTDLSHLLFTCWSTSSTGVVHLNANELLSSSICKSLQWPLIAYNKIPRFSG